MREVHEVLELVCNEESFVDFLDSLRADRESTVSNENAKPSPSFGPDAGGWENTSIESFLESAVAWAKVSANGHWAYVKPDNPWRRVADILYVARTYE